MITACAGVGFLGVVIGRASYRIPELGPKDGVVAPGGAVADGGGARQAGDTAPGSSAQPRQQFDVTDDPNAHRGIPLRPMDRDIFAQLVNEQLERKQMNDVFPGREYRIVFMGSVSEHRMGLVMVDLDRDGKFEERWELKGNDVVRKVQQDAAAGGVAVQYTLSHGRWLPR